MGVGIVGMGRMGSGIAARLRDAGHDVVGYDRDPARGDVGSLPEMVAGLGAPPRTVWLMLPAGEATGAVVGELAGLLERGDLVVDGGNADFRDSLRRAERLAASGIGFCDAGVSGGLAGREHGYCLTVGGSGPDVARLRPLLDALATPGGAAHVGPVGAGHFAKMVHNGVEYGLMQAYAEGYELLAAADLDIDVAAVLDAWAHGAVVRSWLLDLLVAAVADDPGLGSVAGWVEDSGEGRWAVREAVRLAVPVPVTSAALYARFSSRQPDSPAARVVAALRERFGGHAPRRR